MNRLLFACVFTMCAITGCVYLPVNQNGDEMFEPVDTGEYTGEDVLIQSLLTENGAEPWIDFAMVINQKQELKNVERNNTVYHWPEIDFEHYSLVVGKYYTRSTGGFEIASQRIVKGLFASTLYIEIKSITDTHYFTQADNYFAAIYPKLPDGVLQVSKKSEY